MTPAAPLPAGFADPAFESQAVFRAVLAAFAQPGRVTEAAVADPPPAPLMPATAAVALTLFDLSTPVWLGPGIATPAATDYLRFHTGCPIIEDPTAAAFTVQAGDCTALPALTVGTPDYPDRSATAIVQVSGLDAGHGMRLRGPGIETESRLTVTGVAAGFWDYVRRNGQMFPLGIDFVLAAGDRLACLPRTTKVED